MNHGSLFRRYFMAERKQRDKCLEAIGQFIYNKRQSMGGIYRNREGFIADRQNVIFNNTICNDWISLRHLANIERGKNWPSLPMLIMLAHALEEDPVDFFEDIYKIYIQFQSANQE